MPVFWIIIAEPREFSTTWFRLEQQTCIFVFDKLASGLWGGDSALKRLRPGATLFKSLDGAFDCVPSFSYLSL